MALYFIAVPKFSTLICNRVKFIKFDYEYHSSFLSIFNFHHTATQILLSIFRVCPAATQILLSLSISIFHHVATQILVSIVNYKFLHVATQILYLLSQHQWQLCDKFPSSILLYRCYMFEICYCNC